MSSITRKNYGIAVAAVERIKRYWRNHKDAHTFGTLEVRFHPGTFEIQSNLGPDGYPPRRV